MSDIKTTDNIIELNKDVEAFVIQGASGRCRPFKDKYKPLQFVHFADVHNKPQQWNRIVEYVNHYEDYISFALHTGDYCGSSQLEYTDFYGQCDKCVRPIYNCVGNHDTEADESWRQGKPNMSSKENVYRKLFNHPDNWGDVTYMEGEFSMTYYMDIEASNVRVVVLDCYYDIEKQQKWLGDTLADAKNKGLHVLTAVHEITDHICSPLDTAFHTANDYFSICGRDKKNPFEDIIADFIDNGGIHVCNLAGHHHYDMLGFTQRGVLNCAVECATTWAGWCDGQRVKGTRTQDSFNVVGIDTNIGVLKLIRVGNNTDIFLRRKQTLSYDYINKKLIYNG